ncbi:MAG TPA: TRAP transporter substrate-binding protein [Xanthobacteraceae bacterium]|nr:TRAP transporter substrate-binding protein [Xanthobacteraceae bacterium]
MRLARRTLLTAMMASLAAPAVLRLARADTAQVTLKLHHFFSSVSSGHDKFLAPWARKLEAQSAGRIRIDIFPSMQLGGAPAQLFDQARDGLADIVWMMPASTPGRFAKIETFELPFVPSHRALVNSRAVEDYAAANLQDEFREVHPLSFSCRDHGVLHASRTIASIGDLKGLRLHVPNRLAAETVRALDARDVAAPIPQLPMAIAAHRIDGCLDPWDLVPGLRLHDLLKAHTDFAESSLSTTAFVLAMNKASYERLPRELKTVIDNNSGQVAAGMAGAMWDLEAAAAADMVRQRGGAVTMLTAEQIATWRKATAPVIAAWLRQMRESGIDGDKLVESARALLAKYASEPEPQPLQQPQPNAATEPRQHPQAKAETKAETQKSDAPAAPAARAAPAAKSIPPKELDIPL